MYSCILYLLPQTSIRMAICALLGTPIEIASIQNHIRALKSISQFVCVQVHPHICTHYIDGTKQPRNRTWVFGCVCGCGGGSAEAKSAHKETYSVPSWSPHPSHVVRDAVGFRFRIPPCVLVLDCTHLNYILYIVRLSSLVCGSPHICGLFSKCVLVGGMQNVCAVGATSRKSMRLS